MRLTYLNGSTATVLLYMEWSFRMKLPMPIFSFFAVNFSSKYEPRHELYCLKAGIKVHLVIARGHAHQVPQ